MKVKAKEAWIQALKSDEFKCHNGTQLVNKKGEYSVLGVLCKVYARDQKKKPFDPQSKFFLPDRVRVWAGLKSAAVQINLENPKSKIESDLWKMNTEKSVKQIINIINKNL